MALIACKLAKIYYFVRPLFFSIKTLMTQFSSTWDEYNNSIRSETKLGHRPSFMFVPPQETCRGNDAVVNLILHLRKAKKMCFNEVF
jgi:hypothetical protein